MEIKDEDFNDLIEYLQHDSWRCVYYLECHCGLNDLTDKIGIERIQFKHENCEEIPH
jgi:hypothetical protein